jgi:hypothetical protein
VIRPALSAAIALAVGTYLGHHLSGGAEESRAIGSAPPVAAARAERAEPASCATLPRSDIELLKRTLVAAIREQADVVSSYEARLEPPADETTAQSLYADESIRARLDYALAVGRWTDEDSAAMQELSSRASVHAQRQALLDLVSALNEQRLELETTGPLF